MNLLSLFRNIWPYVRPYRWLVLLTLLLTLAGSLMAQVNAVVLDRAVDAINTLIHTVEGPSSSASTRLLLTVSAVLLGKELLSVLITFAQRYFGERMRILVSRDMAQDVVDRLLTFRMDFFSAPDNEAGKLQTRIDRGVSSLSNTVKNFFIDVLPLFTSALLALGLMFAANLYVGLVALSIVPFYFLITHHEAQRLKGWRRAMFAHHQMRSHGIMNIIESIAVIKSFNREAIESDKQRTVQQNITDNQMQTRRLSFLYDGLKSFTEQIGTVLVIILTALLVLTGYPGMTIGKIMYHVVLFANVTAPIRQLHRIYDDLNDALIYAEGFFNLTSATDEVEASGSYRPAQVHGHFELQHVDFTYHNGVHALSDISMEIQAGQITALVGLSGAGKSTIISLLDKFYTPQYGTILLDGVPLPQWNTQTLRANIGLVLQKNHIFDGSIEENIRYGKPSATPDEVAEAARRAYIYDTIMALPDGFASSALQLSGGQQQRIAIARMFLKNPPIIFLDEPTASLDAVATEQIKASIEAIKRGRTVIIISHNIGQIIDADIVYTLRAGHVEQHGPPDELYRRGGIYRDIFDASARSLNVDKIASTIGHTS